MTQLTSAIHGLANTTEAGAAAWKPAGSKQARGRDEPFSENSQRRSWATGQRERAQVVAPLTRTDGQHAPFPSPLLLFPPEMQT